MLRSDVIDRCECECDECVCVCVSETTTATTATRISPLATRRNYHIAIRILVNKYRSKASKYRSSTGFEGLWKRFLGGKVGGVLVVKKWVGRSSPFSCIQRAIMAPWHHDVRYFSTAAAVVVVLLFIFFSLPFFFFFLLLLVASLTHSLTLFSSPAQLTSHVRKLLRHFSP
jgi:hypothetical protein